MNVAFIEDIHQENMYDVFHCDCDEIDKRISTTKLHAIIDAGAKKTVVGAERTEERLKN